MDTPACPFTAGRRRVGQRLAHQVQHGPCAEVWPAQARRRRALAVSRAPPGPPPRGEPCLARARCSRRREAWSIFFVSYFFKEQFGVSLKTGILPRHQALGFSNENLELNQRDYAPAHPCAAPAAPTARVASWRARATRPAPPRTRAPACSARLRRRPLHARRRSALHAPAPAVRPGCHTHAAAGRPGSGAGACQGQKLEEGSWIGSGIMVLLGRSSEFFEAILEFVANFFHLVASFLRRHLGKGSHVSVLTSALSPGP